MSNLFIVRHCESEANVQEILASQMDYPLSDKGRSDAESIAREFKQTQSLDLIIASPLIRAQQTAQAFARLFSIEILTDHRLLEQHLGNYSGMTYEQVEHEPGYEHNKLKRWDWIPVGGGESYARITHRIRDFFTNRSELYRDKRILIVTHAVTMRLIRMVLDDTEPNYPTELAKNGEIWNYAFPTSAFVGLEAADGL